MEGGMGGKVGGDDGRGNEENKSTVSENLFLTKGRHCYFH
jgi:hypothetical protein